MGGRRRAEAASKNIARTDWGTPEPVLECVRECGPIGLDPCTNEHSIVQAAVAYQLDMLPGGLIRGNERVIPGDGLIRPWDTDAGSTYVNHPFSADQVVCWDGKSRRTNEAWARRAAHQAPSCPGGIFMLTPCNPCSMWWRWYWDYASLICFWDGRITFHGAPFSADFEVALVWFEGPRGHGSTTDRWLRVYDALRQRGRTVQAPGGYAGTRLREVP